MHMDGINKSMLDIGSDNAFSILNRSNDLISQGKDVINLCIGQPDFPTSNNIIDAACRALKDGKHGYTSSNGIFELRKSVSNDFSKRNNIEVFRSPEGNCDALAEHTTGMLLSLIHRIPKANTEVKNNVNKT